MADKNNPGQFGNRDDTEETASKGGQASSGSFGSENAADPHEAGSKSSGKFGEENAADPHEVGQEGGRVSSGSFGSENAADPHEAGREGAEAQPTEAKAAGGRHSHEGDQ